MGPGGLLRDAFERDEFFSFILYAPPGTGKTSLAHLIKSHTKKNRVVFLNAITSGVKEVREVIDGAKLWKGSQRQGTLVVIDEIHRFSKSQQDVLLAAVENGDIILVGATTENPSYELNAALLSRVKIFRLNALEKEDLQKILARGVEFLISTGRLTETVDDEILHRLAEATSGDARSALNVLERLAPQPTLAKLEKILEGRSLQHDKSGDLHHQIVSAFIKSMRAGETEAALYYLARLWEAGEDPLFIVRRMLIFASEDVGNADLRAIALMNAVRSSVEFVGRPESFYALSQGVIYLSKAQKSREAGDSFERAREKVKRLGSLPPPDFLMNQRTALDRQLGRGRARRNDESFLPVDLSELS
jgi:putative ATPase